MSEKKLQIREQVTSFSGYDVEGSVDEFIKTLENYKSGYGSDIRVSFYHDDNGSEFNVYRYREESDEDYKARMNQEAIWKERVVASELEQLKKLKEKYGL